MKINCIIVDDETLAVEVLQSFLNTYIDFDVLAVFNNAEEALSFLNHNKVDVLFLDINMPVMNGIDLIKSYDNKHNTKIIVTTEYREFAADCFDLDVVDYLLKPIPVSRFIKCIKKVEQHIKKDLILAEKTDFIVLKVEKKMVKVALNNILFAEGMKEYVKIITTESTYITHRTLVSIEEELPENLFVRVHKSFIVSRSKIVSKTGNLLQVADYTIPIGRTYSKSVKTSIL